MMRLFTAALGGLAILSACAAPRAPRLDGLGDHHFPVTSKRPEAQRFVDQGLQLCYAGHRAEALRAFEEAARLDPACAMAYWGQALALGPQLDAPMTPAAEARAQAAIGKAIARSGSVTPRERGLIEALSLRFGPTGGSTRQERDAAYADAMRALAWRYPEDADIATLATAAFMETRPWDYWTPDGAPRAGTEENVAALEGVLRREPDHPGAIRYYIHLVEASSDPDRAVPYADRLGQLMPSAGSMVHAPSHVYMRVGRYADASNANVSALLAERDYLSQCKAQGLDPVGHQAHSMSLLWAASTMEGRSARALESARELAAEPSTPGCSAWSPLTPEVQRATPYLALVRFGRWRAMLDQPAPPAEARFQTAVWRYARGIALAALARPGEAEQELAALQALAADPELAETPLGLDSAGDVLALAERCLTGEIAARSGRLDEALAQLREAVRLQDGLAYTEPPAWHYPVRQSLGALLVEAGRLDEAEAVYREDLARWRENGWSLFGLTQVLRLKGRRAEAAEVEQRFARAFRDADVQLTASVFR